MSRQSEAKERQGYNPQASQRVCATCIDFKCDTEDRLDWRGNKSGENQTNLRCDVGRFAVKKLAVCDMWTSKT